MGRLPLAIMLVAAVVFGVSLWRGDGNAPFYALALALWLLGVLMGVYRRT